MASPKPPVLPVQEVVYTVTVKRQPLATEYEMYNVSDDPTELSNLYDDLAFGAEQDILAVLLQEQCALKRRTPVSGSVTGQPLTC